MLGNRREFLKYINEALSKTPKYDENFTKEVHQSIIKKLKKELPTCPIVCMEGKVFEQIQIRMDYANCDDLGKEMRDEILKDHKTQTEKIDGLMRNVAKLANEEDRNLELTPVTIDMLKRIGENRKAFIEHAEARKDEALALLDNLLNNPLDYESKGMPFEMLMLLSTEPSGLLGILFIELDPESWMVLEVRKEVSQILTGMTVRVSMLGGILKAEDAQVKAMDYLLNQRANVIEIEPTSIGLGQHITFLPRKTRQLPQHVLYIGTKKKFLKDHPQQASRIMRKPVFAHMVKGHWRVLWGKQHQGKDRHGKPIFNGYTWVIAHKRGKGELTDNPVYVVKQS